MVGRDKEKKREGWIKGKWGGKVQRGCAPLFFSLIGLLLIEFTKGKS